MRIRLLTIVTLFLVATNMGWAEISIIYVNGSSGDDTNNSGTSLQTPVQTIAKAITLVSEGGTIYVAPGEYTDDINISKPLNLIGSGTDKPTQESTSSNDAYLTGKIQITKTGATTIKNVKMIRTTNTSYGDGHGMIEMTVANVTLTVDSCCMINSKSGSANTGAGTNHFITIGANALGAIVNLTNSDLYMDGTFQRAITNRTPAGVNIRVEKSQIIGIGTNTQCRPLALYNEGSKTEIINSKILLNEHGYAISAECKNSEITIDNSEIRGFAALAIREAGMTISITNSILTGRQNYSGASDGYGVLVFEYGVDPTNNTVTINNSIITNEHVNSASACMYPIDFGDKATNNMVKLKDCRLRLTSDHTPAMIFRFDANNNVQLEGNGNVFSYNTTSDPLTKANQNEVLANDKESCVIAYKADGSLMNAITDWNSFSNSGIISFKDVSRLTIPEGTFTLPQPLVLDKSLTIEGAGKDKTIIKGHIEVSPGEGVTATLTAKGITLEGNNNSSKHGIIGITGKGTGKVDLTNCKISGGTLTGQTAAVGVRMESVGAELSMKNTDVDAYYYGIGVRNTDQKVTIDGGIIEGWAALMTSAGGLSSSDGSLASTNTLIKISNATLNAATISDEVYGAVVLQEKYNGVELTIDESEIIATDKRKDKHAKGVKMLSALDLRSFGNKITVNGGSLSSSFGENAVGGAVISLGYSGNDDKSALANNTITINSDLKGKEGELLVYSNHKGKAKEYDKLTINGTDYSISSGLICYGAPITSGETLEQALADATDGEMISVSKDITLEKPLVINKAITLTSANKSTIKGHLVIDAEGVTVKGLKFECNSTGYLYNEKNAISVFANKVTLTENEFTQAAGIGESYVTNGIVLYPQGSDQEVSASYNVTGNTFRGITKKAGTATSTPIIIRENFSDKSQLGEKAPTATLKDFTTDAAFVAQNSFENCAGGEYYVRTKGNKYVYASLYSEENNTAITEAQKYTDKNTILFISNLKVDALASLITGNLPEFAYIECSDALVVTTKDKVSSLPANNKPVAMLKKNGGKTEFEYITSLPTVSKLTASGVDAGKTLSTAILKGGEAIVDGKSITGTFAWEHPDTIAVTSVKNYNVVFTPSDLTRYGKVTMSIPVEVTQYWTVTAGICNNGKITITNGNAGNRYVDGTVLTLNYIPDAHYKVNADAPKTITVTKDQELTATFEQIMHQVTITTPTGGTLKVMNGDTEVSTGTRIAEGTVLKVIATPTTTGGNGNGYKLVSLTAGSNPVSNNAVTVNGPVTIAASFEALPASEFTVGFANDIQNGKLTIMDANNNIANAGASVKGGTEVKVIAIPDQGYELDENGIKVSGQPITGNVYKVNGNTVFSAGFTRKKYEVTKSATKCTLVIKNEDSEVSGETLKQIAYGTVLTATATVTDADYKLGSIIVNGKEIPNGGEFTVTENTKVVVTTIEKATINFINLKQTATYDGTGKQFVVQSVPAGLSGFEVSYEGVTSGSLPVNAANNDKKVYKVTITRKADETYKAVSIKEGASLTIEAAELTGIPAPTYNNSQWTCPAGTCTAQQVAETAFYNVTVTPSDGNYKTAVFNLPQSTDDLIPVSLSNSGLRSMSLRNGEEATLTISATNGGVSLWNGGEKLTETSIVYVGQTLTVKGEPNAGYSTLASWTINGGTPTSDEKATITLGQRNTINVTFQKKSAPTHQPTVETATFTYTGNPIQPIIKLENSSIVWNILVKKDGIIVENPTDAGTYDVWAQCSEQQQYSAFDGKIGSYTIEPQKISSGIEVTSATPILKGQNIGLSELAGNALVEGVFSWKNPEQPAEGDTDDATTSKEYEVTFTPASSNYSVESLDLKQAIPFYAVTKVETRKVTFAEAVNGTFIVKVNGTEVKSGAQITKDDKITVETSPNANYTASVSINNTAVTTFTVPATGDVTIVVSFTQNSTGDNEGEGGDEPGVIVITGVSLNPASKTLAVDEEFTLQATVTPADADQSVTWSSSDETVATVHNGTVKALKAGKATITATASDNEHYATCEVTVSVSTGIEELLASTHVQGHDGHILIEPATTVEAFITDMTGRIIYHGQITDKVQIAVSEGLYLVRLSNDQKAVTIKVMVR